jgi:hypothetical protein
MGELRREGFSNPIEPDPEALIRKTTIVVAGLTVVVACVAATFLEFSSRSAHMAMANLPLAVLLPFVFWLLLNVILKRTIPRYSLTSSELRMILSMLWVGGSFAGYNWITQWVGAMAAPRYYASPENRWQELIFEYLPWWMFPSDFPGVVEGFFLGIDKNAGTPWGAWFGPIFWSISAGLAMTVIGLGLTAIFQKQWVNHERLTYPLAQVPIDLTEGFDRKQGFLDRVRRCRIAFALESRRVLDACLSQNGHFRRILRTQRPKGRRGFKILAALLVQAFAHCYRIHLPL